MSGCDGNAREKRSESKAQCCVLCAGNANISTLYTSIRRLYIDRAEGRTYHTVQRSTGVESVPDTSTCTPVVVEYKVPVLSLTSVSIEGGSNRSSIMTYNSSTGKRCTVVLQVHNYYCSTPSTIYTYTEIGGRTTKYKRHRGVRRRDDATSSNMRKAVTAAALCSVASAAATSVPSKQAYAVPLSVVRTRGGDSAINSTSIPKPTINKRKKRTNKKANKKAVDIDVDLQGEGDDKECNPIQREETSTSSSPKESESHEQTQAQTQTQQEKQPTTDPLLESLLVEEDYYAILGVSKTATESQIKKAYRKRAVQTHPDKTNGDRRAFDKVSEAYTILSDETKRPLYDRFGKKGLEQQAGSFPTGRGAEEFFRHLFGHQQHVPRNRTVRYQLEVSLEDLYKGMTQSILIEQPNGRKKVQVHIPKGTASGESIVLSGEMDDYADATPGDLVFLLQQQPHATFTRKGHDLAMELSISLNEAVGGVDCEITHLDGRKLVLRSARSIQDTAYWIQTGDVHVLKGEGMPKRDSAACDFGDLYVQFRVEMPKATHADRLSADERAQLQKLLQKLEGKKAAPPLREDAPLRVMEKAKLSDFGTASGPFRVHQDDHAHLGDDSQGDFRQSFHWSNTGGFGHAHPFFGGPRAGHDRDDGSNVQCQQM
jgi:DnaJ-class molecular chaperone